jgi:RNA polymerase sigma factor (sigma-70 family)
VNAALVKMLRYPDVDAFLQVNAADVYVDPDDRNKWKALVDGDMQYASFEMRDRCYDGSIIWVSDTASAVRDESGSVLYYQGMLEDITERKEAQEALRESEARFRLLATASDDVIWDWDVESGAVRWNEALRTVFGFGPEDIGPGIEHSYAWWTAHIHPDDRARVANELHSAVQGSAEEWVGEYRFRRLDGSYARVVDRGYIGRDDSGNATRIIGALIDLDRPDSALRTRDIEYPRAPTEPPVPVTSDATLIAWIADESERAFDELYARHAAFVFAIVRPLVQVSAEADEVVADVFLQIWKSARQYDMNRGTVSAWVANIARARSLERLRKAGRRQRLSDQRPIDPAPVDSGPDSDAVDPATEMLLQKSLAQLPEPQRRVIELAYFNGLSHAEIARRLGEPLGTVKTRLRAGLEKLRRSLSEN